MYWYEEEVQYLERARDANPLPDAPVVFYGSSSIRLWDSLADDFPTLRPINLGFGGSTMEACAWFFERLVVPYHPRSLIVYAGDNDLGDGHPPDKVVQSFRELRQKTLLNLGCIPFTFVSIKPSPARWYLINEIRRTNDQIRHYLSDRSTDYYIDVFSAMLDERGQPRPELYVEDGLHMSAAGYRLWTEILSAHLL